MLDAARNDEQFAGAERDRVVTLGPGELFVVPQGIEHRPVARRGEVRLMLIEPAGTPNTGDPQTAAQKVEI